MCQQRGTGTRGAITGVTTALFSISAIPLAFFQLLVNVVFASGLGALLAQASKRILIVVAAIVLAYFGLASLIAMNKNDKGHELFQQHHYAEVAQAYHQAALFTPLDASLVVGLILEDNSLLPAEVRSGIDHR